MKREFPLAGVEMSSTIDRLKAMADESANALLTEGPVHPDHQLLDLCAEALHHRRLHDEARAVWTENDRQRFSDCETQRRPHFTNAEAADSAAEFNQFRAFDDAMRRVLFKAQKLKATTAAGIYAKALIVRSSRSGAMLLAMSLAEDLIACPGLRESLWPAGEGGYATASMARRSEDLPGLRGVPGPAGL
jgi:hypothetical protein